MHPKIVQVTVYQPERRKAQIFQYHLIAHSLNAAENVHKQPYFSTNQPN